MIILDTGVLRGLGLKSSLAELLRAIKESGVERVAVPWMVLEELAAQQALKYVGAHAKAQEAQEELARATPWPTNRAPKADVEKVREHWRQEYRSFVEVIEPSPEALRRGLYREANLLAPARTVTAKNRPVKIGARDSVIWLSAIEYARSHEDETVYFVSGNTKDFGDASTRPLLLDDDLAGLADRFVHLTSVDDVAQRFTLPVKPDAAWYQAALSEPSLLQLVEQSAKELLARDPDELLHVPQWSRPYTGLGFAPRSWDSAEPNGWETDESLVTVNWMEWDGLPRATVFQISDSSSYEIGGKVGQIWSTANVRWSLHGMAFNASYSTQQISCLWETRVMFAHGGSPVVLSHSRPRAYTDEERAAANLR